jgi:predicted RNA-binding Zn ribbon-like protein
MLLGNRLLRYRSTHLAGNASSRYADQVANFPSGNGSTWLDLLATKRGRYRAQQIDDIDSPAALRAWLRENALEPLGALTAADVNSADTVRETLHRLAVAAIRGERPQPGDVRSIEQTLQADRGVRIRVGTDGLTVNRPASSAEALARLTREAVHDLTRPRRANLHACGDDTCGGIFLDHTGRRRWCSDERCGNRMRVQAHRARARQQPGS